LLKLALNAGQALDATTMSVYQALWEDAFEDLSYSVLEGAFKMTLREAKYWPIKVADIRQHIDRTHEAASAEAAEIEWQRMLDLRRGYWAPDMPSGFLRGMPKLQERVQRAANASGVFKLQDCEPDVLHVWGKRRFIESYIRYGELDQFLLPDGDLKNVLFGVAEKMTLPSPDVFAESRARGLAYAEKIKSAGVAPGRRLLWKSREEREIAYKTLEKINRSKDIS
jgi:hypothetical protein